MEYLKYKPHNFVPQSLYIYNTPYVLPYRFPYQLLFKVIQIQFFRSRLNVDNIPMGMASVQHIFRAESLSSFSQPLTFIFICVTGNVACSCFFKLYLPWETLCVIKHITTNLYYFRYFELPKGTTLGPLFLRVCLQK